MKSVWKLILGVVAASALAQQATAASCDRIILQEGRCKADRFDVSCKAKGVIEGGAKAKLSYAFDEIAVAQLELDHQSLPVKLGLRPGDGLVKSARLRELIQGLEDSGKRGLGCQVELCVNIDVVSSRGEVLIRSSKSNCENLNRIDLFAER